GDHPRQLANPDGDALALDRPELPPVVARPNPDRHVGAPLERLERDPQLFAPVAAGERPKRLAVVLGCAWLAGWVRVVWGDVHSSVPGYPDSFRPFLMSSCPALRNASST